jgi:ParB family chromosome partitioning protein
VSRDTQLGTKTVIERLPIDLLHLSAARPPGFVPRASTALVERIRRYGPIDPVVVRQEVSTGRYEILSNPEVWVATGRAGRHDVPVMLRDDLTDGQAAEIVRQQYGADASSPLDEARRFRAALDAHGGPTRRGSITFVAAEVGRSRAYVAHALRLLDLPDDVQALLEGGDLTPGHLRPLVTLRDPKLQRLLARQFIDQRLSVREAEQRVRETRAGTQSLPGPDARVAPAADVDVRHLESSMTELLGCRFHVDEQRGVAEIAYYGDLEILQGVLERLGYRA